MFRRFGLYSLTFFAAVVMAGCNGSQIPVIAHDGIRENAMRLGSARASWMLPQAKSENLLYVSDYATGTVYAYTYPAGSLFGMLTGFTEPEGLCVDKGGDIFITDGADRRVFEYAHGAATPIAILTHNGEHPSSCSVDPTTGNLAVTYYGSAKMNDVAIFPGAQGRPKAYRIRRWFLYSSCAYDNAGSLFVDGMYALEKGSTGQIGVAELPSGSDHLILVLTLLFGFTGIGDVQWDGKYVAIGSNGQGERQPATISQYAVSGSTLKKVGQTSLDGAQSVAQFWIQGNKVIAPSVDGFMPSGNNIKIHKYPAGGRAIKSIKGLSWPWGATVSLAR